MPIRLSSPTLRRGLLASSALALIGAAGPALAQEAVDAIVVTGYRASTAAAIDSKRRSAEILDSVGQDDISQLPDLNIVETVRRIPGVSVAAGVDSTKNRDLYQRATIRGLDPRYNLTTVDGVQIASALGADAMTLGAAALPFRANLFAPWTS